ncbi:chitooligosaccharidolytic beta-N-acetylglucosaminidase-like isoform X2 [Thrips palmi]|uniref:Beta-hexosaminidase n=1 Tax=Thrips palmi TaxID=161013 RepID=A0A6P8YET0_THRPL|nr:chitooligosaccharidolytic beta-N-acetylglucosaminidase-like isoform X2 [Thrips palmi]
MAPGVRLDVEVCVETDALSLDWSSDESYVLEGLEKLDSDAAAPPGQGRQGVVVARIRAATFFGARHALESLSQLIAHTGPPPDGSSDGLLVIVDRFTVTDAPAFPHRGLLLDTSRNYYPPAYIRATINAMAQNKLNVLHWHITDSQSFPYESTSLPQMSAFGAYSPRETYPAATVRELSRFALSRGVRLLPELDAPAHVAAGWGWGRAAGLGDLVVCEAQQPWIRYCVEPPCGQLNPANPNVYRVLAALFDDMLKDFYDAPSSPVPFFHMGGDEVHMGCWNSSKEVLDYMARSLGRPKRRKEDFVALWGHFQARATQALDKAQRDMQPPQPDLPTTEGPLLPDVDADVNDVREGEVNSVLRRRQAPDDGPLAAQAAVGPVELVELPEVAEDIDDGLQEGRASPSQSGSGIPVILWTSELTAADVVQKYLDKDRYVIQLWLRAGDPLARDLVSKGYRVIVSTKDAWYLDHGFGNWKGNSTAGYLYHPWQVAYDNDPLAGLGGLGDVSRQVLGGEAAMWGEQADQSGASTKEMFLVATCWRGVGCLC